MGGERRGARQPTSLPAPLPAYELQAGPLQPATAAAAVAASEMHARASRDGLASQAMLELQRGSGGAAAAADCRRTSST